MNFKKIHKQVNEFALKLPLTLCQVQPKILSLNEVCLFPTSNKSVRKYIGKCK